MTPIARRELEQAFLRVLRAREPGYVWRVLPPDELDAILDGGTLASAGGGSDDSAIEDAARQAQIDDEVLAFQGGYDTVIGQRADAVSGGQRQRICLARALAGQPDMLVLDEPTSALDMRSEELVQRSLLDLRGTVTMLIVAHRLSTLNVCDRLMVFDSGRLEAFGSATELVNSNEFFRNAVSLTRVAGADGLL